MIFNMSTTVSGGGGVETAAVSMTNLEPDAEVTYTDASMTVNTTTIDLSAVEMPVGSLLVYKHSLMPGPLPLVINGITLLWSFTARREDVIIAVYEVTG